MTIATAVLPANGQIWLPKPPASHAGRYIIRILDADDDYVTYTIVKRGVDLQTQTKVRLSTFMSRFDFLATGA